MICKVQDPLQCPAPNAGHAGRPNNRHFRVPGLKFGEALVKRKGKMLIKIGNWQTLSLKRTLARMRSQVSLEPRQSKMKRTLKVSGSSLLTRLDAASKEEILTTLIFTLRWLTQSSGESPFIDLKMLMRSSTSDWLGANMPKENDDFSAAATLVTTARRADVVASRSSMLQELEENVRDEVLKSV